MLTIRLNNGQKFRAQLSWRDLVMLLEVDKELCQSLLEHQVSSFHNSLYSIKTSMIDVRDSLPCLESIKMNSDGSVVIYVIFSDLNILGKYRYGKIVIDHTKVLNVNGISECLLNKLNDFFLKRRKRNESEIAEAECEEANGLVPVC